ncbi:MAG: HNH endonuclease [Bacteroidia bacterium]
MDPLAAKYPFYSPYAFSGNRVLDAVELEGAEPVRATSPAPQPQMRVIRGGQYGKGSSQPFNPGDPVSERAIQYNRPASPTVESQVYSLLTWKLLADWLFPQETPKTSSEFTNDPVENQRRINHAKSYAYRIQNGLKDYNRIQEAFENVGNGNASAEDLNIFNREIKIRNSHLAESNHPKTDVPFDVDGFPDFSGNLYPDGPNDVMITPTGDRDNDFSAANKEAGYNFTPKGYTWHHYQDYGRMQLVESEIHNKTGHTGGFYLWPRK